MKISQKTKSSAYRFIKSLMKDGAEGEDIHNLVAAISDNVSAEIGGEILADLIRNPEDENAEKVHAQYWFGPIESNYYHVVTKHWAEYCDELEIQATFRFGEIKEWKEWRKTGNRQISDEELADKQKLCNSALMVFEWWGDAMTNKQIEGRLSQLHDAVKQAMEDEAKKKAR